MEIQKCRDFAGKELDYKNEDLHLKFLDLEQKLVEDNLQKIKNFESDNQMAERLGAIKEKYNQIVSSKRKLQEELCQSEEEKLQLSKQLIDLQLENTKLLEQIE